MKSLMLITTKYLFLPRLIGMILLILISSSVPGYSNEKFGDATMNITSKMILQEKTPSPRKA
ncbi:MAG: hypothetical protein KAJ10_15230, partial [Thermodesulfovibrionia bacterium]|nr:hypothetical protein [Thermodesulfovibrionia bacterium]